MEVLGRTGGGGPTATLGTFRARDGSAGAPVGVDLDGPHVALVVGKRGYGKSYTLGVFAEELARARGVAPVVLDPMGTFGTLAAPADGDPVPARVIERPRVGAGAIPPRWWCSLLDLDPESAAGALVWQAAATADTLAGMREEIRASDAARDAIRAAINHLDMAGSWGVFAPDGLDASALFGGEVTVLDCSGMADAAINAVGFAVARVLYDVRVSASRHRAREAVRTDSVDTQESSAAPDAAGTAPGPESEPAGETDSRSATVAVDLGSGSSPTTVDRDRTGIADRLPWLLVDEAHALFDGTAGPALRTILTRGRQPGVSLVAATQRPGALPDVATSQADLLVAHRLTAREDRRALERAAPSYMGGTFAERMPDEPGEALVVDDVTERVHAVSVRERDTPHGGDSPRASAVGT